MSLFLKRRKRPSSPQEILAGLEQGGFDFKSLGWKDSDRLRIISSSIAKNTKAFHKLPGGNAFGLVEWYDLKPDSDEDSEPKPAKVAAPTEIPAAEGKSTGKEKTE